MYFQIQVGKRLYNLKEKNEIGNSDYTKANEHVKMIFYNNIK